MTDHMYVKFIIREIDLQSFHDTLFLSVSCEIVGEQTYGCSAEIAFLQMIIRCGSNLSSASYISKELI